MDAAKCEIFLRALDRGSLSRAAEELGYTPSGISRSIAALEDELGFSLLVRSRAGVVPTENGQRMIPLFRQFLYWNEQCQQVSAEIRGIDKGTITIGANYSLSYHWLPGILARFEEEHPNIHVQILEGCGRDLHNFLEERRVDFCISAYQKGPWDWLPLQDDELAAWLPADHPLAEQLLVRNGLKPHIKYTTVDSFAAYSMVEAGLGLSINNVLMAKSWNGRVKILPLDPPQILHLGILVPNLRDASPAARKCIECVRQIVSSL